MTGAIVFACIGWCVAALLFWWMGQISDNLDDALEQNRYLARSLSETRSQLRKALEEDRSTSP